MFLIKSLNDANLFIDNFTAYAELDTEDVKHTFTFTNENLSARSGKTNFYRTQGKFFHYNYGSGWVDQSPDEIDEPDRYVWENRKCINAQLKQNSKPEEY